MQRFSKRCWIILFALFLTGCKSADNPAPSTTTTPASSPSAASTSSATTAASTPVPGVSGAATDPCTLLTNEDLKAVQGEDLKQASRSDQPNDSYIMSQCYFQMTTPVNSVVINLTAAKSGGQSAKALWEQIFEGGGREEEEEGEKAAKPEKVPGLGQEALWIGSRVGGALYVLRKDLIFRISVGGAGDMKAKLAKSKTLATKALARIK